MREILKVHSLDNVVVALKPFCRGQVIEGTLLLDDIPAGHKLALQGIRPGEKVIKFGYPIGVATVLIVPGSHVHSHNVESSLQGNLSESEFRGLQIKQDPASTVEPIFFDGFRRPNGKVGVRNEIWIVNTVACVNHASERIAQEATRRFVKPGGLIDGVHAFPHPYGCSQLGDDLQYTQRVLAGLVHHPNAAAILLLGLGCENNQMRLMLEQIGFVDSRRVLYFNAQEVNDEVEEALRHLEKLADYAGQFHREPVPGRELMLGMKCGGSDGFSGITANPLVGRIADRMSASGATTLLSEVPEMFGAEEVLLERTADKQVFAATIQMVNKFRDYFRAHHQPIDENPSPGNKEGGITTLAEKSLGCVQKGGTARVSQILEYGQPALPATGGLALVNAPGNDGVSSTAMTVAGAHLLLFTTGRGTPMGFPVPTLKISTNTPLAERKAAWIDFNAGVLADSLVDIDELADQLLQQVIDVASGRVRTRNEEYGYREIAIWKTGVTV